MAADEWTFAERVDDFLALASRIVDMRLIQSGIDLSANFHWSVDGAMSGSIAPIDDENLRSFLTAWRQLVTRDEPAHLPTLLAMSAHHLTIETLRELSEWMGAWLERINAGDAHGGFRMTFSGPKPRHTSGGEYTPWEVADLVMHGLVFHGKDRFKRKVLAEVGPAFRAMLDFTFRQYILDIVAVMDATRTILLKAKEKDAIANDPVRWGPANILRPEETSRG